MSTFADGTAVVCTICPITQVHLGCLLCERIADLLSHWWRHLLGGLLTHGYGDLLCRRIGEVGVQAWWFEPLSVGNEHRQYTVHVTQEHSKTYQRTCYVFYFSAKRSYK